MRAARTGCRGHAVRSERPERTRRAEVRIAAVATWPRPGTLRRISRLRAIGASSAMRFAISASSSLICRSTSARRVLVWRLRTRLPWVWPRLRKRVRSFTSPVRATCKSLRSQEASETGRSGSGLSAAPIRARTRASTVSVLARAPLVLVLEPMAPRWATLTNGAQWLTLGEAPSLQRVDLHQRQPPGERRFEIAVVRAGRIIDQKHRRGVPHPSREALDPVAVLSNRARNDWATATARHDWRGVR